MQTAKKMRNEAWACPTASKAAKKYGRRRMLFDEAFELARRAEAIGRQEDASALKAARLTYSLFLLDGGQFDAAHHFDIASKEAALAVAYAVHDACSEWFQDFELWQGSRLVAANAHKRGLRSVGDTGQLAAAAQGMLRTDE